MKLNKVISLIVFMLLLSSFAYASQSDFGTHEQNTDIELIQLCGSCTYNNITSIIFPNKTKLIIDDSMTKRGTEFNYTFSTTDSLGEYYVNGVGDKDGVATVWAYTFTVTENGKPEPEGITIVIFGVIFFILVAWIIITLYNNIGHLVSVDYDIMDLAYSMIGFFGFLIYYYLASIYFPKQFVMDILNVFLGVLGFTHLIVPMIGWIFVIIKQRRIAAE